jgi:hypothetical protein
MNTATMAADYHCSITAKIPTKIAFDKIGQVSSWWATDFEGSAQKPGDTFTIRFGTTWVTFEITEAIEGQKITWQVLDCEIPWLADKKEWTGTAIRWEVAASDDGTRIDMTHVGLLPSVECYDNCQKGWNHFIRESLFRFLTSDEGLPEGPGRPRAPR